jgi:hypothetical protein
LQYTKYLEDSGVDRKQAEAFAKAQMQSLSELMKEKLATKEDLRDVKVELKDDLTKLATKEELKELRSEMRWLSGATITILSLVMAALKFFH